MKGSKPKIYITKFGGSNMDTIVDTRTMLVVNVFTDEGPVSFVNCSNEESEFGMPFWDYD